MVKKKKTGASGISYWLLASLTSFHSLDASSPHAGVLGCNHLDDLEALRLQTHVAKHLDTLFSQKGASFLNKFTIGATLASFFFLPELIYHGYMIYSFLFL